MGIEDKPSDQAFALSPRFSEGAAFWQGGKGITDQPAGAVSGGSSRLRSILVFCCRDRASAPIGLPWVFGRGENILAWARQALADHDRLVHAVGDAARDELRETPKFGVAPAYGRQAAFGGFKRTPDHFNHAAYLSWLKIQLSIP